MVVLSLALLAGTGAAVAPMAHADTGDSPTISPAGPNTDEPTLTDDSVLTFTGSKPAQVAYSVTGRAADGTVVNDSANLGVQALPFTLAMPSLPVGNFMFSVTAAFFEPTAENPTAEGLPIEGFYNLSIDHHLPAKLTLAGAGTFYPHKDGFADAFSLAVTPSTSGTARLYISKGRKVVSRSQPKAMVHGFPTYINAGSGLAPGKYTWSLVFTTHSGAVTTTAPKALVADPRVAVSHQGVLHSSGAAAFTSDNSGVCGHSTKAGSVVLINVDALACTASNPGASVAGAQFEPSLIRAPGYGKTFTVTVHTSGTQARVNIINPVTGDPIVSADTVAGSATVTADSGLLTLKHQPDIVVAIPDGQTDIDSIDVRYRYLTLAAPTKRR